MESSIVKQGARGDVDIGMGVGDLLDLAEDPRGNLSQRGDDPEVRVIGAEFRSDLELQSPVGPPPARLHARIHRSDGQLGVPLE